MARNSRERAHQSKRFPKEQPGTGSWMSEHTGSKRLLVLCGRASISQRWDTSVLNNKNLRTTRAVEVPVDFAGLIQEWEHLVDRRLDHAVSRRPASAGQPKKM